MKFNFEKFKQSLLDNESITTDEMELTIKLVAEFIENEKLKTYAIFRNGTQQGTLKAKNLREAKKEVSAYYGYGKNLQVYLDEEEIEEEILN
jgi:hypothetical protein